MLIQAVHEVTSGLMKLVSSEEFRPSATALIFGASVTILISTVGIHKEIMSIEILECKNVCVTAVPPPNALQRLYLSHAVNLLACFLSVASQ